MLMLRFVLLLIPIYISISYSTQFAHELFKYDNLELYPKRVVESIVVPREIDDVAYISFSAEHVSNVSQDDNSTSKDRAGCNPIVAKVVLEGLIEILWNTSLEIGMAKTRHTSLSLSPDGKKLYVTATFFNANSTDHKFQVLAINAEDGVLEQPVFVSNFPGSQIVRSMVVNHAGIYICGRSTTAKIEKDTPVDVIQRWNYLLFKISFSGVIEWQYSKNTGNKSCEAVAQRAGNVYTVGNTWMNDTTFGVVYKHSAEGAFVWGRRVRSTLKLPMRSREILVNNDGIFLSNYLPQTDTGTRSFVQKMSERGTLLWSREVGEGLPGGLGYRLGYLFALVTGTTDTGSGMTVVRLDRFADGLKVMNLDIPSGNIKARWVWLSSAFLIVSKSAGNVIYGIGSREGVTVDDTTIGTEEYEIRLTISMETGDLQVVKDYLSDVTHGGIVRCTHRDGYVIVLIVVRESSEEGFKEVYERVESVLRRDKEGRSKVEQEFDIVVDVRNKEFRRIETSGSVSKVGTIVAIVVGVCFVVIVVCVWFCASNWFSFAGEHVGMV